MSILLAVKNFARNFLGIGNDTENTTANKTGNITANTPIIQVDAGRNEDVVKFSNSGDGNISNNESIKQLKETIIVKCRANNLDLDKIIAYILKNSEITNFESIKSMSLAEQKELLIIINAIVDKTIELQKQYGKSHETSTQAIVETIAKDTYEAIQAGTFESIEELEDKVGNVNQELGSDFREIPIHERRRRMEDHAKRHKDEFEKELQDMLKNVPEDQRARIEKKWREQYDVISKRRFQDVVATGDTDTALQAMVMVPAKYMAQSAQVVLGTRANKQERMKAADKANYSHTEGLMKSYYERGEQPPKEVIQSYTKMMVSAKSNEAVIQYQEDYNASRQAYENGERVPEYLSPEFYTATATGIGVGATLNENMSTTQKAEFLAKWENDAKQYSDYEVVMANVNAEIQLYLEKHPEKAEELRSIKAELEKIIQKVINAKKTSEEQVKTKAQKDSKSNLVKYLDFVSINQEVCSKPEISASKEINSNSENKKVKNVVTNPIEIREAISKTSVSKALENYSTEDVVHEVLRNPQFSHFRPQIIPYLKSYDLAQLIKATRGIGTSDFLFVLRNITPEKAGELYDARTDLCYSAKQLGKELIQKDKEYGIS